MTLSINRLNPNCTTFTVGNRTWYWSFNNCVAYKSDAIEDGPLQVRARSDFSITTAKHLNYMGVSDWPRVDDATFEKIAGGSES